MSRVADAVAWMFIGGFIMFALSHLASEAKAGSDASGPNLYRDLLTGCEYLTTSHDTALTPRIAADGKTHLGCKGTSRQLPT